MKKPSLKDIAEEKLKEEAIRRGVDLAANSVTDNSLPSGTEGPVQPNSNNTGQVGAGAVGLYNAYDQYQKGNKGAAAVSGAQGATNVAAGLGSSSAAAAVPYVGAATAAYGVGKTLTNSNLSDSQKAEMARRQLEDTGAAIVTLGGSAAAQFADQKLLGGKGEKLREKIQKYDPAVRAQDWMGTKALGFIGGGSNTKGEEKARASLAEQGTIIPNSEVKEWENNEKFRNSRQESDLVGKDIQNAASLHSISGYNKLDPAKQEAIAQEALTRGLVREHHGQVDIGMDAEFQKYLDTTMGGGEKPQEGRRVEPQDNRRQRAEGKRDRQDRQRAQLADIIPAEITKAPRYDIDVSELMRNKYL